MKKYVVLYRLPSGWWDGSGLFRKKRKAKKYAASEELRTNIKHRVFKKI